MKLIPGLLSELFPGMLLSGPALIIVIMLWSFIVCSFKIPPFLPFLSAAFSGENPSDEGVRVGRSIQMSIWLLGNRAHSGTVTFQSYVEIRAELRGLSVQWHLLRWISVRSLWSWWKLLNLHSCFFWGLFNSLFQRSVCGKTDFFLNKNEVVSVQVETVNPHLSLWSVDVCVPFWAGVGSRFYNDPEAILVSSFRFSLYLCLCQVCFRF